MRIIIAIFVLIVFTLLTLFIIFPNQVESILSNYPNSLKALTAIFTFLTTAISIGIAYKSYSSNIKLLKEDKEKQSYKIKRLVYAEIKDFIHKLRGFHTTYENKNTQLEDDFFLDNIKRLDLENELGRIAKVIKDIRKSKIDSLTSQDDKKLENDLEIIDLLEVITALYRYSKEMRDSMEKERLKEQEKLLMREINKLTQRFK